MRAQGPGTRGERERALVSGGEGEGPLVSGRPRESPPSPARGQIGIRYMGSKMTILLNPASSHLRRELVSPHQFSFPGPDGMVDGREAIQPSPHESVAICAIRDFPGKDRESVQDVRRFLAE